ncbi:MULTISPECIES: isoprenoid biosynthesis glyoxalase ElbB [unclassified Neptuniibacter]|uniref:isoprenoid biosynthesis glyoxalase ElbB n=1 Tax=unclassified Neptuniibacter TaxID=2630693 RepID=UPI000C59DC55|nr:MULTISPECIES: isoprenoid biosynthesis glyoxalase ElbB [unclassified Neptuniibacter]MAY41871.1 isoprenoid biosynthesis protein ElbB [Oceanospirillaceae bacterium]|tara:strand:+ start:8617 stop:9270 length:654 start_codon:yes stop_codon:yes gene_type:complete
MKKVAVILSGCGVYDGAEIYESVLTLLSIAENGAESQCMAPNIEQMHVVNHLTGEPSEGESRNVLVESARLARGEIIDLTTANPADYDALIIPGGFGAAKNLSDFALNGSNCQVNPDVVAFTQAIHNAGKPVGLMCIAPAMTPLLFGDSVNFTIGTDPETAGAIESMGGTHNNCSVDQIVIDETLKVVTTPAYMLAGSITEVAAGIRKLVDQVVKMA